MEIPKETYSKHRFSFIFHNFNYKRKRIFEFVIKELRQHSLIDLMESTSRKRDGTIFHRLNATRIRVAEFDQIL